MKSKLKNLWPVVILAFYLSFFPSCADPCKDVSCQNGGHCVDGECGCTQEWTGTNCEVFKCDQLNCQNGSICESGECQCQPGYYGTLCESKIINRFVGNYSQATTCTQTGGGSSTAGGNVTLSAGSLPIEIRVAGLGSPAFSLTGYFQDENNFDLPQQNKGSYTVSGFGTRYGDEKVTINFTYGNSGVTYCCSAILTRVN
ncbi:MAG: hypothetical protein H6581_25560 [Bacteroidia bacterium]|nr:hypothetical protein [Bacteroidia bacterium]